MKRKNIRNATIVGTGVGAVATPAIAWGAAVLEVKTGVPASVTLPLLGAVAGLLTRWAARLNPND